MMKKLISIFVLCLMVISTISVPTVVMAGETPLENETIFSLDAVLKNLANNTENAPYTGADINTAMQAVDPKASVYVGNPDNVSYVVGEDGGHKTLRAFSPENSTAPLALTYGAVSGNNKAIYRADTTELM